MKIGNLWLILALVLALVLPLGVSCGGGDDDDDDGGDSSASPWTQEIIDNEGNVGRYNDMDIDAGGNLHVSYFDADNQNLRYANNASGEWMMEVPPILETTAAAGPNAIGVDNDGRVWLAFCASGLFLTVKEGGDWSSPQNFADVDHSPDCDKDIDMEVNPAGVAHLVFSTVSGGLAHIKLDKSGDGAVPSITTVDAGGGVDTGSVSIGADNSLHATYYKSGALYYAFYNSGGWDSEVVDDSGDTGRYSSVSFDGANAHISYFNETDGVLMYAMGNIGAWDTIAIDDTANVGLYTDTTLDSGGNVHISYYGKPSLRYANNLGGIWENSQADAKVGTGETDTNIEIDADDYIHITYYDFNNHSLKYAHSKDPVTNIEF